MKQKNYRKINKVKFTILSHNIISKLKINKNQSKTKLMKWK